ncbi:MAG TPA: corrinoid protein [Desulfatiglandales bacterium]|nr:corrinoid protein [Desulfatiglandales bacterium]
MDWHEIQNATIKGDQAQVVTLTQKFIAEGRDPDEIIQNGYIPAMEVVGDKYSNGEFFVPEMLMAARAMKSALEILKPLRVSQGTGKQATFVLGTVRGDLHDIGKNLVGMMLEGANIDVIDLGVDIAPESFLDAVEKHAPQFVGLSALLTTTIDAMRETVSLLKNANLEVKIFVGGAPITQKFADEIGADGYAEDAGEAVKRVKEMLSL